MIQFFKRLLAAIFGKKEAAVIAPNTSAQSASSNQVKIDEMDKDLARKQAEEIARKQADELARKQADELTKVKQLRESRKWSMKNNRIIIQYNDQCRNVRMNGKRESMRCTRLERAREIAAGIQSYCVKKIVFADYTGQQFIIKSFN